MAPLGSISFIVLQRRDFGIGLVCVSVCCDSSEMARRNFFTLYISIRYDLGMMAVFSNFLYCIYYNADNPLQLQHEGVAATPLSTIGWVVHVQLIKCISLRAQKIKNSL